MAINGSRRPPLNLLLIIYKLVKDAEANEEIPVQQVSSFASVSITINTQLQPVCSSIQPLVVELEGKLNDARIVTGRNDAPTPSRLVNLTSGERACYRASS